MEKKISLARKDDAPLLNVLGVGVQVLLDESDTNGRGVVGLCVCDPGQGAPPHLHDQVEFFFVLKGTVSFFDGDNWQLASEGDSLKVPAGCVHAFRNDTTDTVRFLTISAPAAHARFFREADKLYKTECMNPSSIGDLCRDNGITLAL